MDLDVFSLPTGITILTGNRGSGKTRTCQKWVEEARQKGWSVTGLLCPAVFDTGEKIGIDVVNLASGEKHRLANAISQQTSDIITDHWDFIPESLAWGNDILGSTTICDLLVVDELGPLEFYRRQGWVNAFDALDSGFYQKAVVVIRPELMKEAIELWPAANIVDIASSRGK